MFKHITIIIAAAIAAGGALAQEVRGEPFDGEATHDVSHATLRYQVRADLEAARMSGAWPVQEYNDMPVVTAPQPARKAPRRPRKEYPNVMGISLKEWLARQE
jgi:hypothetical protein